MHKMPVSRVEMGYFLYSARKMLAFYIFHSVQTGYFSFLQMALLTSNNVLVCGHPDYMLMSKQVFSIFFGEYQALIISL